MSVEFTFAGSSLTVDDCDDVLQAWSEEREDALFGEPCFVRGQAQLLAPGSIRGVLLAHEDDQLQVRLSALASRADWRMAYEVMARFLAEGEGVLKREDGQVLAASDLTPERADQDAVRDFCASARALQDHLGEDGSAELPIAAFSLVVQPGDVPICADAAQVEAVEAALSTRVARYAEAYPASVMVLTNDVRLTTWAKIPTLVGKAHLIAVEGLERPIPAERVRELLGPRVEEAGRDLWYLPGLDETADADLLAALRASSVDVDAFAAQNVERIAQDALEANDAKDAREAAGERDLADPFTVMRALASRLIEGMAARRSPEDVRRELVREGVPAETVDVVLMVLGRALQAFSVEAPPEPTQVFEALVADGVPAPLAEAVLLSLLEGASGEGDEHDHSACDHEH
jgi:hypothetical protein